MTSFQIFSILLTVAALGAYINLKFLKLPAMIGIMLVALVISLGMLGLEKLGLVSLESVSVPLSQIDFSGLFLHGILAFLLFAGALHVDLSELRRFRILIAILATAGVVVATFVTGGLVWHAANLLGFPFSYVHALLFGALIAPTDPVAVLSVLKESRLSKALRIKIAGESLFNDGVAVVLFLLLLGMTGDRPLPHGGEMLFLFFWKGLGSIVLGLFLGWATFVLLRPIDDYKVEVLLTLALVAGGYSLAESIDMSAPITMVVAGLLMGNHGRVFGMSEKTRRHLDVFWELLDEVLNALLFIFLGLVMIVITVTGMHLALGLVAIVAMLVGRFISVAIPVLIMRLHYRFEKGTIRLLTWGGLRGGISIAMVLSLPQGADKDIMLAMTYLAVIFSILFQGTTFRHVARMVVRPP
ncbi:MAG: cation:proton antiporter [Bdellovibrionales bacterium]